MALNFRPSFRPLLKYSSSSSFSPSVRLAATITVADDVPDAATTSGAETASGFGFDVADLAAARPISEIPGPRRLPFIGTMHTFKGWPGGNIDPFDARTRGKIYEEKYGKIHKGHLPFLPGMETVITLLDPQDFNIVFRNEGNSTTRSKKSK